MLLGSAADRLLHWKKSNQIFATKTDIDITIYLDRYCYIYANGLLQSDVITGSWKKLYLDQLSVQWQFHHSIEVSAAVPCRIATQLHSNWRQSISRLLFETWEFCGSVIFPNNKCHWAKTKSISCFRPIYCKRTEFAAHMCIYMHAMNPNYIDKSILCSAMAPCKPLALPPSLGWSLMPQVKAGFWEDRGKKTKVIHKDSKTLQFMVCLTSRNLGPTHHHQFWWLYWWRRHDGHQFVLDPHFDLAHTHISVCMCLMVSCLLMQNYCKIRISSTWSFEFSRLGICACLNYHLSFIQMSRTKLWFSTTQALVSLTLRNSWISINLVRICFMSI